MENLKKFNNLSLLKDIKSGLFTDRSYSYHCTQNPDYSIQLNLYHYTVRELDNDNYEIIASYNYRNKKQIAEDLGNGAIITFSSRGIVRTEDKNKYVLKATFEKGKSMPEEIIQILDCIDYHNREGLKEYENNIYGTLGMKHTHERARKSSIESWLLDAMLIDCNVFILPDMKQYKCGRGGSHVWIAENEERFVMIHL